MRKFSLFLMVLTISLFTASGAMANLKKVKGCPTKVAKDARAVAKFIDGHWTQFEAFLVANSKAKSIKKCLENRFRKNGKVICMSATGKCKCTAKKRSKNNCANAWAAYTNKKCHLCPSFLNRIKDFTTDNRRACMAALMTHEFGHTCWRGHRTTEDFDNAAFNFWKKNHSGVTINLASCGTD